MPPAYNMGVAYPGLAEHNYWQTHMFWLVVMVVSVKCELSKVLGTAFGLSLDVHDVDEFLMGKICKKITYWKIIQNICH